MADPGPAPVVVDAPPVLAPAGLAPLAPTSYRELFADSTRDAVFGHPAEYLAGVKILAKTSRYLASPGIARMSHEQDRYT